MLDAGQELVPYQPLSPSTHQSWGSGVAPMALLASKVQPQEAPSLIRDLARIRERVEYEREVTQRHAQDIGLAKTRAESERDVEIENIRADRVLRIARIQADRDVETSRHQMVTTVMAAALKLAVPRDIHGIRFTERTGRWWSNFEKQYIFEIY